MDCAMSTYIKAAQSAAMSSTTAITASSRRYHLPIHIGYWLRETRQDRKEKGQEGPTPQVSGKYAPGA